MASKESDQLLEDELQALHQSIAQLNSGDSVTKQCSNRENASKKNNKRRRVNQADVQTQTPKKSRKCQAPLPEDLSEDMVNPIDDILEDIAQRKNLTTNNVKHLLRNIIANESVQEMLKCSLDSSLKMNFEPKLTRSKTKEWLETQNIVYPSTSKKSSDTHILMDGDFPEDSSDDEYRPNEEDTDNHSDEESFLSSHASDVGSPASSAPPTPSVLNIDETFKRPFPIEPIQDDLIGSRTRSKLPLNDTPLEHLELAFIPPDISTDMYDSDCDNNEEWRLFLKEFICPTSHHSTENADDEEADPEYNILEEEEEVDDEELRADRTVQITKKEVSELLSELFEEDLTSSDDEASQSAKKSSEDILQNAMSDIIVQLDPSSPEGSKAAPKPTGIVQPLVPSPENVPNSVAYTISFPTIDCAPIEIYPSVPPSSTCSNENAVEPYVVELTPEARMLLSEQMRKHVQLLTQMHLITAQQSSLASVTEECRSMLHELLPLNRVVEIANVEEAVELVAYWDQVVVKHSPEELQRFQRTVVDCGNKKKFFKRSSKHPDRFPFNPQMIELMADSRVFIYPELLPKLAIFQAEPGPCKASPHEEQLIAMGLEQFTPFCTELLSKSDASTDSLVCSMISYYMLPNWTGKNIGQRIKRLCLQKSPPNPVKYYMEHKVAPPVNHAVQPFDRSSTKRLCDVPPSMLPKRWRELMLIHAGQLHRDRKKSLTTILKPLVHVNPTAPVVLQYLNPPCGQTELALVPFVPQTSSASYSRTEPYTKQLAILPKPSETSEEAANRQIVKSLNPTTPVILQYLTPPCGQTEQALVPFVPQTSSSSYSRATPKRKQRAILPKPSETSEKTVNSEIIKDPPDAPKTVNSEITKDPSAALEESQTTETSSDDSSSSVSSVEPNTSAAGIEDIEMDSPPTADDPDVPLDLNSSKEPDVSIKESNDVGMETSPVPELPLDASSPNHLPNTSSSSNQGAKRYVLLQRSTTDETQEIHVWDPTLEGSGAIPSRQVADHQTHNQPDGKSSSTQENHSSTSYAPDGNSGYPSTEGGTGAGAGSSGGDDGDKPPFSPGVGHGSLDENVIIEDDEEEEDNISLDLITASSATHTAPSKGRSPAHRQVRHQRNARRILDSWMADDDPSQPRSDAYAQVYFMKVRDRLEHNPLAFREFVTTLGHFQTSSCSTLELYKKIESTLKDHPDLMEEFVLFLSPESAAQCGVEFQHFLYVRMREFFSKLKIHFKDSPSQLKRTLKTLQQVESAPCPAVNDIKNAILPLLKGNAHLTQAFLQLFPDDAPPPSEAGDFEDINMDHVNSGDEFEYVHLKEASTPSKENEAKGVGRRTGSKGNTKNKTKGKSWKKPTQ